MGSIMRVLPDVSIVIVAYRSKEVIPACLRSVRESTREVSAEMILVDNASNDGVADLVRSEFPEVILIESLENEGFARGINRGAHLSSGRYLMMLNPDTELAPETIKILLNFMEQHPEAGAVGARTTNETRDPTPSVRSLPHICNLVRYPSSCLLRGGRLKRPHRFLLDLWNQDETIDVTRYGGYITGACLMTPLALFKAVGMLDEGYFLYSEDSDFGLKVSRRGHPSFLVSEASVIHLGGRSAVHNVRSRYYFIESYLRYVNKNLAFFHRIVYKICLFLLVVAWMLTDFATGKKSPAASFLAALRLFFLL